MLVTYLFWALLWLPGLALAQRFAKAEVERGTLSALALGYAASFALLCPWSMLCYALQLPLWVFAAVIAASAGLGLFVLVRARMVSALCKVFASDLGLPALLLLGLLVLDARVGGWLDGDATYHVGRIRDLLDHGFSNHDFYLAQPHFAYAYHTNLVHALYAAAAQLTKQDVLVVWSASLPWAKLAIAAAHYHLAHVLFQKRWVAWLAALVVSISRAGESYSVYPNLLAVGWLSPLVLAAGFAAHEPESDRTRTLTSIAVGSLLLGQVHPLYWVFVCLALAPLFLLHALLISRVQRNRAGFFSLCLLTLLTAAPFAWILRYAAEPSAEQVRTAELSAEALELPQPASAAKTPLKLQKPRSPAASSSSGHLEKQLERMPDGQFALSMTAAGGPAFVLFGFLAIAVCLRWPEPLRPRMLALAVAAVTLVAIPLSPRLCTFVVTHFLPGFGVARMITLASTLLLIAISGGVALLVDRLSSTPAFRNTLIAIAVLGATQLPGHAPRSFSQHLALALQNPAQRHAKLEMHRARRVLLRSQIPAGETVLTTLREARYAVMLYDLHVVATDRAQGRVPLLEVRRNHVELMTQPQLAWPLRERLLHHYGLRFVIYRDKHEQRFNWARQHGDLLGRAGGLQLVKLRQGP